MSGHSLLVDTNIVLYALSNDAVILSLLEDKKLSVSFVTEIELLSYPATTEKENKLILSFLSLCTILEMDSEIKQLTVQLRRKYKLKLPDALIAATALHYKLAFLTAVKGFAKVDGLPVAIYQP